MAEPLHRLVVAHPRQRQRHVQPQNLLGQPRHQAVDHADDVLGVDERHFQVQLRELRLPIGPQVLVAETAGHLDVAVVAGDHENLLVELRRLRQGVVTALLDAAGHEIIAGPFGRAAAEHRRLDVDEPQRVAVIAHDLDHAMPQEHRPLHLRPPQIDVAILQPDVLARQVLARRLERRSEAPVEHFQVLGAEFDLARVELGVDGSLGPPGDLAAHQHDVLRPQRFGRLQGLVAAFRGENHLGLAVAVAEIDEQHAAMVAVRVDPAAKGHLLPDVVQTQFAAGMSPQQVEVPTKKGCS